RTVITNNTYIYNKRNYYGGPGRSDLARATRSNVRVYNVNNSQRTGRANINARTVSIYSPDVNKNTRTESRPTRVTTAAVRESRSTINTASTTNTRNTTNTRSTTRPSTSVNRSAESRERTTQRTTPQRSTATRN